MKLATLKDGTRDGQLAVVARDLKTAHIADGIAPTLQAALDDWSFIAPQLAALYGDLNAGRARRPFDFEPGRCMAPLPRAYQFIVGAAYDSQSDDGTPRMAQCGSDDLLGPMDDIVVAHEEWGIDFGAGLAVVTDDVSMGATADDAHQQIRLLMVVNEVSLRNLKASEPANDFNCLHGRPTTAFAPLAVTLDELGGAWKDGKVHMPLRVTWNGHLVGEPHAGIDMVFNFPQLIAHLAKTRNLHAGAIVGSGVIPAKDPLHGYSSIDAQRCRERVEHGAAMTQYMRFGDTIRVDMLDDARRSVCGAIEQRVERQKR